MARPTRVVGLVGLVGFVLATVAPPVEASLITPISLSRSVSAEASVVDIVSGAVLDSDGASDSAADFGSFGASANATFADVYALAQSSQSAALVDDPLGPGTEGIGVLGQTRANGHNPGSSLIAAYSQANSDFSITFAVAQPTPYEFFATAFSVFDDSTGFPNESIASFSLSGGPDDEIIASGLARNQDVEVFRQTGVLLPGEYLLEASAESSHVINLPDDSTARYQVELYLIPEPSTALLCAAGLVALGLRRRRGPPP